MTQPAAWRVREPLPKPVCHEPEKTGKHPSTEKLLHTGFPSQSADPKIPADSTKEGLTQANEIWTSVRHGQESKNNSCEKADFKTRPFPDVI